MNMQTRPAKTRRKRNALVALMAATAGVAISSEAANAQYIYRVNSGGGANGPLAADQYFSDYNSGAFTYNDAPINRDAVSNPLPESAYKDVRAAYNGSPIAYTFPNLTAGKYYRVRLHFFDFYATATRTQSVVINGRSYLQNFDIGGTDKVSVQDFTAAANAQGQLVVDIAGGNDNPFLSAIEVLETQVYFVATTGNNNWAGTLAAPNSGRTNGPFATVAKARDAIRALKSSGQFNKPVTVFVRNGTYYQSQTLQFTPQDSGTGVNSISYEAYPGETPVVSGGRRLTGWTTTTVNGKTAWKRTLSDVASGSYFFRELWVNGQRRIRSRYPDLNVGNNTFLRIQGPVPGDNDIPGRNNRRFVYRNSDLDGLNSGGDVTNGEMVLIGSWRSSHLPITGLDTANNVIDFSKETATELGNGDRYWVENTLSGLNQPGEWYLNRTSGVLYYLPKPGETTSNTTIIAPVLTNIVRFDGNPGGNQSITDLTVRGLTFANAQWWFPATFLAGGPDLGDLANTWTNGVYENSGFSTEGGQFQTAGVEAAVVANGVKYSTFDRNTFRNMGGYAFELYEGAQYNRVQGNKITDIGGGIKQGPRFTDGPGLLDTRDNIITDNTISDGGHRFTGAVAILWAFTRNTLMTHNTVFDFNYSGIAGGSQDDFDPNMVNNNRIVHNEVHHVGQNRNFS
ncbi:MAG: right-handed parallel beta-helix repeat-containing protein, partial [Akkermansiaceae bacterium]|nr:right-handed parallel beta-helix repeat-containing protein [Armatimonadota bacterium]